MGFGAFISLGLAKVAGVVTPVKVTKQKRHIRDEEGEKRKKPPSKTRNSNMGNGLLFRIGRSAPNLGGAFSTTCLVFCV